MALNVVCLTTFNLIHFNLNLEFRGYRAPRCLAINSKWDHYYPMNFPWQLHRPLIIPRPMAALPSCHRLASDYSAESPRYHRPARVTCAYTACPPAYPDKWNSSGQSNGLVTGPLAVKSRRLYRKDEWPSEIMFRAEREMTRVQSSVRAGYFSDD